jgi:hypothetical protein
MNAQLHYGADAGGQQRAWWLLAVIVAGCGLCPAEQTVDRIAAIVNRHAILASEWEEALGFECLVNGRPLPDFTPADHNQTLQRLIDQELIAEQMSATSWAPATAEEIASRVRDLRNTQPAWKTDEGWRAALAACGLTGDDVEERVAVQVNLLRYLDRRFRPEVRIDQRAIETYYREQLLPQLRRAGSPQPPLNQVAPMIEQLLVEQQINQLQSQWLRTQRSQSEIQVR